ncbi:MAG TPA: NAD-dependent epimerase/dehydratase family protein [Tepidisphaeraceae bacterium]|jgi:dTDP-glucose 4,6-dehydratase|nr:NAD-dependent epimerase/dehydratase family protein [Tepidisphaeraceae bacterium]
MTAARIDREDLDHILEHTAGVWEFARNESFFITGGTGFVGTWLVESLLWANTVHQLDAKVTVLTRDPQRYRSRSPHLACDQAVTLLGGSAEDFRFPSGSFAFVIHAATEAPRDPDLSSPVGTFDADIEGTRRVLEFARVADAKRVLFTSSGAVYGRPPPELQSIPETYFGAPAPTDTSSAYAQAKRISEFFCSMYARVYGVNVGIARLFAFVGPHLPLDAHYAIGNFIRDALNGGPVKISGDGTPYRSYLYAGDLAIWLWTILFRGGAGRAYNVGSPEAIAIADLARMVAPGCELHFARRAEVGSKPPRYVPSTIRAQEELGLRTWIALPTSIKRTKAWNARSVTFSNASGPPDAESRAVEPTTEGE